MDSVKRIGCTELEWPCPIVREGHENGDDEHDGEHDDEHENGAHEATCAALKLVVDAAGIIAQL